ncbi:MAG: hypothetical protein JST15_04620 [Bacteroidetes bacterium]|nr:hypothetical protein [Bacteroidota bacterium]
MKGSRLYEILSSLSKEEFNGLNEYLHSPYLNKNKQVILFYYFLSAKQIHPDYSLINREEVFDYVYKSQEFNPDKYLKLCSDFVKALENFLICELRSGRDIMNKRRLLEISGSRNLSKTFSKYSGELNHKFNSEFNKDLDFYLTEYECKVESVMYNFSSKNFNLEKALLEINEIINIIVVHSKLELMIKLLHISDRKNRIWFDKETLKFAEKNKNSLKQFHPMIYLRYLILKMFSDSDADVYKQIKNFVSKNENKFSKDNLRYVYDKMITFCNLNGTDEYKSEEFKIIKSLDKNCLIAAGNDHIDYVYFLKVVDTSLSENDSYWAESFINKYNDKLEPAFRQSSLNLAMASVLIYRHKYKEALNHVSKIDFLNDLFYLSSKSMSLIIFYELNDLQAVNYILDAFKAYLSRNRHKKDFDFNSYRSFLAVYKQLLSISSKNKKSSDKKSLLDKINNDHALLNKDWFARKLASIEIGNKNN